MHNQCAHRSDKRDLQLLLRLAYVPLGSPLLGEALGTDDVNAQGACCVVFHYCYCESIQLLPAIAVLKSHITSLHYNMSVM